MLPGMFKTSAVRCPQAEEVRELCRSMGLRLDKEQDVQDFTEGLLKGKRVGIKDNVCVAGVPMLNGNIDASVVTRGRPTASTGVIVAVVSQTIPVPPRTPLSRSAPRGVRAVKEP
ncbi:hypothetical protein DPMN_010284 [Dreissena polymorpha]|uniref:Uncharacterized protein n=1 Tax=Dreissena polymorpha TaxID=45954 RepID=A0A9D4MYI9_DREPO|nr:hypothetical protein DPMN_010284 [Dreissena polymorpha]